MSQHDVEDLVSESVAVLGNAEALEPRLGRDLVYNLYRIQSQFDCGNTYGRVQEILVAKRYLLVFPLDAHPAVTRFPALFAKLTERRHSELTYIERADGARGLR